MASKQAHYDVIVVGAGLIGLAAAIALHAQGKRVVLVDARSNINHQVERDWDTRIYAITPSTEAFLQEVGVWSLLDSTRVNNVDAMALWHDAAPPLNLLAEDASLSKLACIVENNNMMQALWQKIEMLEIPVLIGSPCLEITYADDEVILTLADQQQLLASLLVGADGANSFVRQQCSIATYQKPFNQTALVANYQVEKHHEDVARQWFAPHETLALLPLPAQHVSMVWALETELAESLLGLSKEALAEQVCQRTSSALGHLTPGSETLSFPLNQETAVSSIAERVVLMGDAAHRVHPMAGQGANLGFRDVISLTALIARSHAMADVGEHAFLRRYERERKADVLSMNTLTSGLDYLFAMESNLVKTVTAAGMRQLDKHTSIKRFLINQAVA